MSSRQLEALADRIPEGLLGPDGNDPRAVLAELLRVAYTRFPGAFWVNFQLANTSPRISGVARVERLHHLYAALAARPRSMAAHLALGDALLEDREDDPEGFALIREAAAIDP